MRNYDNVSLASETLNNALEPLLSYAFIQRSSQNSSISIHKLVQDIMRDILDDHEMDNGGVLDSLEPQEKKVVYWIERAFESLISHIQTTIRRIGGFAKS